MTVNRFLSLRNRTNVEALSKGDVSSGVPRVVNNLYCRGDVRRACVPSGLQVLYSTTSYARTKNGVLPTFVFLVSFRHFWPTKLSSENQQDRSSNVPQHSKQSRTPETAPPPRVCPREVGGLFGFVAQYVLAETGFLKKALAHWSGGSTRISCNPPPPCNFFSLLSSVAPPTVFAPSAAGTLAGRSLRSLGHMTPRSFLGSKVGLARGRK